MYGVVRWKMIWVTMIWMFFFFNDTATTEIYTLSLHDALPISLMQLLLFVAGFGTLVAVNIELSANCLQLNWYLVYLSVQKVLVDTSQHDLLESKTWDDIC